MCHLFQRSVLLVSMATSYERDSSSVPEMVPFSHLPISFCMYTGCFTIRVGRSCAPRSWHIFWISCLCITCWYTLSIVLIGLSSFTRRFALIFRVYNSSAGLDISASIGVVFKQSSPSSQSDFSALHVFQNCFYGLHKAFSKTIWLRKVRWWCHMFNVPTGLQTSWTLHCCITVHCPWPLSLVSCAHWRSLSRLWLQHYLCTVLWFYGQKEISCNNQWQWCSCRCRKTWDLCRYSAMDSWGISGSFLCDFANGSHILHCLVACSMSLLMLGQKADEYIVTRWLDSLLVDYDHLISSQKVRKFYNCYTLHYYAWT